MTPTINQFRYIAFLLCSVATFNAAGSSPLFTRGYTVIPEPQSVQLTGSDFQFGDGWRLVPRDGVQQDLTAVEILRDELASRHGIRLQMGSKPAPSSKTVLLEIRAGSVTIGSATDRDKEKLAEEAYKLELSPESVTILANAAPGLFYGAETLLQLVRSFNGANWLPAGTIVDWPDLQNRFIYWDDKAHLDRGCPSLPIDEGSSGELNRLLIRRL
jgi:N-acetyl-beta-hexosaminidase